MSEQRRRTIPSVEAVLLGVGALFVGAVVYVSVVEVSDTTVALLGGVAFAGLLLTSGGALIEGLMTGVVRGYFQRPSRSNEPFDFWWATGMWAMIFASTLLLSGAVALDFLNA